MRFKDIRVLIWDFDGTFYKPNQDLFKAVREAEYQTIVNHTGWTKEKTTEEFARLHKKVYTSATEVVSKLCKISIARAATEMEKYFDRRVYIHRDEKLIHLFSLLKKFRHFILANGMIARHKETLEALGLSAKIFKEIVTAETVVVTKPHEKGFLYILHKTKLPPASHLMIGDRDRVDLAPAKKLGMKTCLVWADKDCDVADVVLPTVYDVAKILV